MENLKKYKNFIKEQYSPKDDEYVDKRQKIVDKRILEIETKKEIQNEIDFLENQKYWILKLDYKDVSYDVNQASDKDSMGMTLIRMIDQRIKELKKLLKKLS